MYYYMYTVEGAGNRKPLRVVVPRHTPSVPAAAATPADQGSTTTKETFRLRETDNTLPFSSFYFLIVFILLFLLYSADQDGFDNESSVRRIVLFVFLNAPLPNSRRNQ